MNLSHHPHPDGPESLGVMARRDHEQTVVYLHLRELEAHGELVDHALDLTPSEAIHLADALISTAELVRNTPPH